MSIVLNEYAWAEEAIKNRNLGMHPVETLGRVARYYTYIGLKKSEVRKKLDEFLAASDPNASLVLWADTLDHVARNAQKYKLIMVDGIHITQPEMEIVDSLEGIQPRRLAFTLLCVAKFRLTVNSKADGWVSTPDKDIMAMANVKTSIKHQCEMFKMLGDLGLIKFSKRIDNTNTQVLYIHNGDIVMTITDFRNLGYQYMMYHGGPYYVCQECGITCKKGGDNPNKSRAKYCPDCYIKIHTQQTVNLIMKQRELVKI